MKSFCCTKCGSIDLFIKDNGDRKSLICSDCGAWIKWIGKKELPLIEKFLADNIKPEEPVSVEAYKQFGKRETFYNIQLQLRAINSRYNTYEEKWNAVIEVMESIGKSLEFNESIFGIATDFSIDADIVNSSRKINNNWNELMK